MRWGKSISHLKSETRLALTPNLSLAPVSLIAPSFHSIITTISLVGVDRTYHRLNPLCRSVSPRYPLPVVMMG